MTSSLVMKTAALAVAMVATTWAAGQATSRWAAPPSLGFTQLAQAPPADGSSAPAAPAPSEAPPPASPGAEAGAPMSSDAPAAESPEQPTTESTQSVPAGEIKELSDAEVKDAITEAQRALSSGAESQGKTPGEFRPSKPLPADIPITLPSDI